MTENIKYGGIHLRRFRYGISVMASDIKRLIPNSGVMKPIDRFTRSKYPGPEDQALSYPWKGIFYSKPYKLKVPIFAWSRNAGLASWPVLNYRRTGMTGRRANLFNFSSLQTLAAILLAEPENSDSRNAGQAWPIEDPALRGRTRFFRAK